MNATQTRATPLDEARQIRAVALVNLQALIREWPRTYDWDRRYRVAFREWGDSHAAVCFLERSGFR